MNKKLLIGGAVAVVGVGILLYLKSKSKGGTTRPAQPPTSQQTPQQQQNSQERQKIYDEIYIKIMSFDTKKGIDIKTGVSRPMTSKEIYDLKKEITDKYNFILSKLNKLSIDELKYYQVVANAISDSEDGKHSALDAIMNDPIKFRQFNDFTTKHADLFN